MAPVSSTLTLDEAHVYRRGGAAIPGVTSILRVIDELDGVPKEYLERAAHFGRHVHKACHLWNQGRLDEESLDAALVPYLQGWKAFLAQTGAQVLESECMVYHAILGYAGTLDALVAWKVSNLPVLLDIKSSAQVPRSVGPQTAMYRAAYLSERPDAKISKTRYAVHLTGNGRYKLVACPDHAGDFNIALSCLNVHRWMEKS